MPKNIDKPPNIYQIIKTDPVRSSLKPMTYVKNNQTNGKKKPIL